MAMKSPLTKTQRLLLMAGGALLMLLAVMLLLLREMNKGEDPAQKQVAVFPVSESVTLQTGGETEASVNLSTIWVEAQGEQTVIQMDMIHVDADGKPIDTQGTPQYEVKLHTQPARLEVILPTMTSWDYNAKLQLAGQSLVTGVFQLVHETEAGGSIFFQMNQEVSMALAEQDGRLTMTLSPQASQSAMSWRVVANAVSGIVASPLIRALQAQGMTPTLSGDLASVTLLSQPFETEREAQAFADTLQQPLSQYMPGDRALVLQLPSDGLPPMLDSADPTLFAHSLVFSPDKNAYTAELVLHNARALTGTAQGDILLLREMPGMAEQDLLRMDTLGRRIPLLETELPLIEDALLSPNGEWAALIEMTQMGRTLYLYRFQTGETVSYEAEVGNIGMGYAWTQSNLLYAMTDSGFYCVNPALPTSDPNAITLADHEPALDGGLKSLGAALYAGDGYGEIYRCDPLTGKRELFAKGGRFEISPDGRYMLAQTFATDDTDAIFKLIDMETKEEALIGDAVDAVDAVFASDSSAVYYLERSGEQNRYVLSHYTIEGKSVTRLGTQSLSSLLPGTAPNEVLVNTALQHGEKTYWAVYRLTAR